MTETFNELMAEAFNKATAYRQRMRLRQMKVRREIDNGEQRQLKEYKRSYSDYLEDKNIWE